MSLTCLRTFYFVYLPFNPEVTFTGVTPYAKKKVPAIVLHIVPICLLKLMVLPLMLAFVA